MHAPTVLESAVAGVALSDLRAAVAGHREEVPHVLVLVLLDVIWGGVRGCLILVHDGNLPCPALRVKVCQDSKSTHTEPDIC